jgi:hypothetical protein
MKYILPSEAQKLIFKMRLGHKYLDTNFKRYKVKDFGIEKLGKLIRFDHDFQRALTGQELGSYSRNDAMNRWIFNLKDSRYCFYSEEEVDNWIVKNYVSTL